MQARPVAHAFLLAMSGFSSSAAALLAASDSASDMQRTGLSITQAFSDPSFSPAESKPQSGAGTARKAVAVAVELAGDSVQLIGRAAPYMASIRRWAGEFGLPESLLLAVIHTESRFDPAARSGANAVGLMQLVADGAGADAWHFISGEKRVPTDQELLDPDTNIRLGAAYLRMLKDHYWSDIEDPAMRRALVLVSYNWGIGNVRRRLRISADLGPDTLKAAIERAAPAETAKYLQAVQQHFDAYEQLLMAGAEEIVAQ